MVTIITGGLAAAEPWWKAFVTPLGIVITISLTFLANRLIEGFKQSNEDRRRARATRIALRAELAVHKITVQGVSEMLANITGQTIAFQLPIFASTPVYDCHVDAIGLLGPEEANTITLCYSVLRTYANTPMLIEGDSGNLTVNSESILPITLFMNYLGTRIDEATSAIEHALSTNDSTMLGRIPLANKALADAFLSILQRMLSHYI